jgi:hypothetical protein
MITIQNTFVVSEKKSCSKARTIYNHKTGMLNADLDFILGFSCYSLQSYCAIEVLGQLIRFPLLSGLRIEDFEKAFAS